MAFWWPEDGDGSLSPSWGLEVSRTVDTSRTSPNTSNGVQLSLIGMQDLKRSSEAVDKMTRRKQKLSK